MEPRSKPAKRTARSGVKSSRTSASPGAEPTLHLPNIDQLADGEGQIIIGGLYPIRCVAIASDGHNALAMLVRREGETLTQLLMRLDAAIAKAYDEDVFTDEVNPPAPQPRSTRRR